MENTLMKLNVLFVASLAALGLLASTGAVAQSANADAAGSRAAHADRGEGKGPRGRGGERGFVFGGIAGLDADNDGRISRAEIEQAQQRMAQARADRGERGQRRGPRNESERTQRPDGTARPAGPRAFGGGLLESFDAIDTNSDGYIVRAELQAWQAQQRSERQAQAEQRAAQRFAEVDTDGDGRLSQAEVAEKWPHIAERFNWFDANRDGYLSPEELRPTGRSRR